LTTTTTTIGNHRDANITKRTTTATKTADPKTTASTTKYYGRCCISRASGWRISRRICRSDSVGPFVGPAVGSAVGAFVCAFVGPFVGTAVVVHSWEL